MHYAWGMEILRDEYGDPLMRGYKIEMTWLEPGKPHGRDTIESLPVEGWKYRDTSLIHPIILPALEKEPDYRVIRQMALERTQTEERVILKLRVRTLIPQTWYLSWFEHGTLRLGRTDAELEECFNRFVMNCEPSPEDPFSEVDKNGRILMGGEDRWRWKFCDEPDCHRCKNGRYAYIQH